MDRMGVDIKLRRQVSMAVFLMLIVLLVAGSFSGFPADSDTLALGNTARQARVLTGGFGSHPEATMPETAASGPSRRNEGDRSEEWVLCVAFFAMAVLVCFLLSRKVHSASLLSHLFCKYNDTILYIAFPVGQHAPPPSSLEDGKFGENAAFGAAPLPCAAG